MDQAAARSELTSYHVPAPGGWAPVSDGDGHLTPAARRGPWWPRHRRPFCPPVAAPGTTRPATWWNPDGPPARRPFAPPVA